MSQGWIKLHRQSLENFLYKEKRAHTRREAWEDLLLLTNHAPTKVLIKNTLIECGRGQSVRSLKQWAELFNWDKSKVKRFFDLLQEENMIVTENVQITTRITICNYERYQDDRNADETQMKRKRNANETQLNPNKNVKKDKNVKKEEETYRAFAHLSITLTDHTKLLKLGYTEGMIKDVYDSIENFRNNKNYKSLYLTAKKWLKKNHPDVKPEISEEKLLSGEPIYDVLYLGDPQHYYHTQAEIENHCIKNNTQVRVKHLYHG